MKPETLKNVIAHAIDDDEVRNDLEVLYNANVPFAQRMLEENGKLGPFAASITTAGKCEYHAIDLGEEFNQGHKLIEFLTKILQDKALQGELRATGICADAFITRPETSTKTDAICLSFEHKRGYYFHIMLPYEKVKPGTVVFGKVLINKFEPAQPIFVSEV